MKMSSSSEPVRSACYTPLEYREVGEEPSSLEAEHAGDSPEARGKQQPASDAAGQAPDPEALFAVRLEAERRAITARVRQEAEREIQRARAQITHAIEQFAQQRDKYFSQVEGEVVSLALAIARRLLHREAQMNPRLLAGLVNYELEQLDAATSVRLLVSPETLNYWSEAAPAMPHAVEILPDKALAAGGVRIETALGSTTVSFERELKEIEHGFFDLLSHRPATEETTAARVQ
jgi:flagellar assembly protein FliH